MEDVVHIRVIGKGGLTKGTVIEDFIEFQELANSENRSEKVMDMVNRMVNELQDYENNYPDELKKELGVPLTPPKTNQP